MSASLSLTARRLPALAAVLFVAAGVSACGLQRRADRPTRSDLQNIYTWAGPITYQVEATRELNPYSTEDAQYLAGIPAAQSIPADQLWLAVFMWAKNQTNGAHTTTDNFELVASDGTVYHPWALNPQINPYAWTAQNLQPDGIEPGPDTTASYGPTQGGLVLFRVNESVFDNRPLSLQIIAPGQAKPSTMSLDL